MYTSVLSMFHIFFFPFYQLRVYRKNNLYTPYPQHPHLLKVPFSYSGFLLLHPGSKRLGTPSTVISNISSLPSFHKVRFRQDKTSTFIESFTTSKGDFCIYPRILTQLERIYVCSSTQVSFGLTKYNSYVKKDVHV